MKLTQSRVSDVIYTPLLKAAADELFPVKSGRTTPEVLGRLLVVFRSPSDRALNRYEATRLLTGNDALSLTDYCTNPIYSENNPLTRDLLGLGPHESIGDAQVKDAQETINQYVFVGLLDEIEETIARYENFFQWQVGGTNPQMRQCHQEVTDSFQTGYRISTNYAAADPIGYNLMMADHAVDNFLYEHAKEQFALQAQMFKGLSGKNQ
jgi:hypothetical protein